MSVLVEIPLSEVSFEASRSGGAGGQHVNKTNSKITLRWKIAESSLLNETQKQRILEKLATRINKEGELLLKVETHKSQYRNKEDAQEFLNSLVNAALKTPKKRKKTRPTRGSKERRLKGKLQRSRQKVLRKLDY